MEGVWNLGEYAMKHKLAKICKNCVFFNGEYCEFHYSPSEVKKSVVCISKIPIYEKNEHFGWTCCGGILLGVDDKCSICGDGYD